MGLVRRKRALLVEGLGGATEIELLRPPPRAPFPSPSTEKYTKKISTRSTTYSSPGSSIFFNHHLGSSISSHTPNLLLTSSPCAQIKQRACLSPHRYLPHWIEEDNKGVRALGIGWLLREDWRGQVASSLVIYMKNLMEVTKLRMGRRLFRTTGYDWDR